VKWHLISFHPTALAGCTSVTDDIETHCAVTSVGTGGIAYAFSDAS